MKKVEQKTLNGKEASTSDELETHVNNEEEIRSGRTRTKESSTRKKVDSWLINLGWNIDEESQNCNVTTERAITVEQNKKLGGYEPDYVLYESGTTEVIGIIETKKKGKDLEQTLIEATQKYAKPLNAPIVFATDGSFVKSWHLKYQKELSIDGEPIIELLSEHRLLRYIKEGAELSSETKEVKYTREQLISIFKWANNLLRKEGLREGIERFTEFANILFLKLISELEIERERNGKKRLLDLKYCWESFADLPQTTMLEYINGTVLPYLVEKYNHSGDVFQTKLSINNPSTLKEIVDRLSKLTLINTESDIKGDAFEYFLKNSVTVGNDLGEYFTPRHIVKLMVKLVNPQFGDKVYDPTCGTGGFLIEAFRHVERTCKPTNENLRKLQEETVYGRELTNTARIAKMNMILTGDGHTNIVQLDSLKYPTKGEYDVVLANPPYGQLTDWGDLYDVPSVQADPIFIQHILLSLNDNGRAAFIAPEGFLFRPGADKKTRIHLLDNFNLIAVISLPAGVFNPYTASKTNILIIERGKTKKVWFYEIHNDGFDLGATRKPINENDIPDLINKWDTKPESNNSWWATKEQIKENDYNLTAKRNNPHPVADFEYADIETLLKELIQNQADVLANLKNIEKDFLK